MGPARPLACFSHKPQHLPNPRGSKSPRVWLQRSICTSNAFCRCVFGHHVTMSIRSILLIAFLFNILPAVEHRAPQGYAGGHTTMPGKSVMPLPPGLTCVLEVPSGSIMLGAGWLAHYVVHNRGTEPFPISFGGDYRAARPTRMWLEAEDPDGQLAADPLAGYDVMCMGGLGGEPSMAPGAEHAMSINARLYVCLDRPGRWTIRVFHDLGYGSPQGDADPRWATATVDLVMPDAEQAKVVLAEHRSRMSENGGTAGMRADPSPDFAAMGFPVYLPLLAAEATAGSSYAIEGISAIPSVEAAEELLRIAERVPPMPLAGEVKRQSSRGSIPLDNPQAAALRALAERLPAPPGQPRVRNPSPRLAATMDSSRIERLGRLALAATTAPDAPVRAAASQALARCVSPLHRERLILALNQAAVNADPSALYGLLLAWRTLPRVALSAPDGDGLALIWLDQVKREKDTRPDGWQDHLAHLLLSPRARIRELAIECIPEVDSERWAPLLLPLLSDPDPSVRWNAVAHAGRCKHISLVPALRQAMDDQQTNSFAANSITAIAGREAGLQAWIDQIESGSFQYAAGLGLQRMWYDLTGTNLCGSWKNSELSEPGRKELAANLRRFVADHRDAIARGPIGPPDATWPVNLLPENWYMPLADDATWPAGRGNKR